MVFSGFLGSSDIYSVGFSTDTFKYCQAKIPPTKPAKTTIIKIPIRVEIPLLLNFD